VVSYLLVAVSFLVLRNKEPDLARPFKVKHWKIVGTGAIGASLFLLSLFTPINVNLVPWSYEWGLILMWTCIGIGLAAYTKIKSKKTTRSERELLLFGEEYAREEYL
jgi:amino acid transporter